MIVKLCKYFLTHQFVHVFWVLKTTVSDLTFVESDLGPNCLEMLSADRKSGQKPIKILRKLQQ